MHTQVPLLVVWCIPGGVGPLVPTPMEHNYCMYAGRAAGSHYTDRGGGANYLCLPEQPQYSNYTPGVQSGRAYLYGTEYQAGGPHQQDNGPLSLGDHNVPCAVCYSSTRPAVVMIPAQYSYLPIILDPRVLWISHGRLV